MARIETDTSLLLGALGGRGLLLAPEDTGGYPGGYAHGCHVHAHVVGRRGEFRGHGRGRPPAAADPGRQAGAILSGSKRPKPSRRRWNWACGMTGATRRWASAWKWAAGCSYAHPGLGLTVDAAVRGLLAHEDANYDEWGASGTVRLAPGAAGQGVSLTLAPAWGATASGVQGLWTRQTTAGLAPAGARPTPAGPAGRGGGLWGPGALRHGIGDALCRHRAGGRAPNRTYRLGARVQVSGRGASGLTAPPWKAHARNPWGPSR